MWVLFRIRRSVKQMSKDAYYVTTPIYYPSDNLHIGHALTTTMADTLARFNRLKGKDTYFLTGSDEHGQKIQRRAKEAGLSPQEFVDRIVAGFQNLWEKLDIEYDDFIRTTEPRHKKVVQEIFKTIYDKGDIYKSEYEGWYCNPCEAFWTERQVEEGNCPDCGRPVELVKEESYFFKMSKYADRLLAHIEANPNFIQPVTRRNEMVSFIKQGLEDLCVSRTTFDWGIPVPINEKHVIYVWFDALSNYVSALGYGSDDPRFDRYWPGARHLVGKDIVRFHTIIWPTILMAADIELPKEVFAHGWLLLEGGKMSKSKGNVVDPLVLIDRYGSDAIRYFLLREMPLGQDFYYSEEALVNRINVDLANDFGNLLSRTTSMINKFAQGEIPAPGDEEPIDVELRELALSIPAEVDKALDKYDFSQALQAIWRLVNRSNKYIEETAPWSLAKNPDTRSRLGTVLYGLAESIRFATVLVSPFMPNVPDKVFAQLGVQGQSRLATWDSVQSWGSLKPGTKISRGNPIFPRIEWKDEEEAQVEAPKAEVKETKKVEETVPGVAQISIEDFAKVDLRLAEILAAQRVEGTDKLMELKVRVGEEERTIVAGIAQYYEATELVGKTIVIVANLKPAKLRGIMSQGMVLAASQGDRLSLLTVERDIPSGAKVK
ncbi:MAG: methionine--tRNA ligase [Clostridia bacterium]|jgi:methionyl-tRNA synthetase|nr:methionine--tRNA ligase [Clostridia bacterium]